MSARILRDLPRLETLTKQDLKNFSKDQLVAYLESQGVDTRDGETKPQLKQKLRDVLSRLRPESVQSRPTFLSEAHISVPSIANNKQEKSTQINVNSNLSGMGGERNEPMQFSASSKQNPQLQSREIQIKLVQCPSCLNNVLFDDNVFSHFKLCNPKLFEDFVNYLSQGGQVSDLFPSLYEMDVPNETETYKDPTPGTTLLRAQSKSTEHVRFFNSVMTDIFTTKMPTAEAILQLKETIIWNREEHSKRIKLLKEELIQLEEQDKQQQQRILNRTSQFLTCISELSQANNSSDINRCKRKFQDAFGTTNDSNKQPNNNNNNSSQTTQQQSQQRLPTVDFISL